MNSSQAREAKLTNATSLWHPAQPVCSTPLIVDFQRCVEETYEENLSGFEQLHQWSVSKPDAFWPLVWQFCDLQGQQGDTAFVHDDDPMRALFFPQAQLNVVETFLKRADDRNAITFISEMGHSIRWTRAELKREVEMLAAALRAEGIGRGDHVVGYVPNMPQTVAAMLATASIGAVWSSCAPESGPDVVVDRFDQIAPKLMFAADGYFYGGKTFDTRGAIAKVAARLPSLQKVVVWPYAQSADHLPDPMMAYDAFQHSDAPELRCEAMGFRDPLYVMFSSGTTGKPKCIEHSGGGTLLRMLSEHQLHCDLRPNDRMFYYTTCNWMMWNWQVAALASEASIVLFDGNPMYPGIERLFQLVADERVTHFGVSAKFIEASQRQGNRPCDAYPMEALRVVLSTGSPLSADGFHHVYRDWKVDVQLASICGGTDILGAFIGGCPILPVYAGQIPCAMLGLDIDTLDEQGTPVSGVAGELVCRNAHPSMPTRFLGDEGGARYRASYFDTYQNIWCQGDFTIRTEQGGFVVLGRSDATLNPGGIRIGTAEIYRQLDKFDAISDAVVVGQKYDNDVRVILFVLLQEGVCLDENLISKIKSGIRSNASPRHVPAKIISVSDIPRTRSGKIAELAVRDTVNDQPVRNLSGIANPEALTLFQNLPELSD